ncbi:D-alanine--D-alanine ligase [Petrocella sp. FN5]|uniref:D-alanine--D-alanine ligase n=1 Tax=Petrocella sp. FN5 TaxID=3032002 RepID=UPI0023DC13B1|nr:D-alanine--D-alanine ligase [Petrocella sp. FN5]MDF1616231.1 D-alanine--D-alanine ligase [Petrocella sp. FN5]
MLRVGVVMGGDSCEHQVSMLTGAEFVKHLNKNKYDVIEVVIEKPKDILKWHGRIDFALLALHGKNGEDGKVQALLEALEIPYSGSGIASSAICLDKNISKLIMESHGVKTPKWIMVKKDYPMSVDLFYGLSLPVIIKPNQGGSSIGIHIAYTYEEIDALLADSFIYDDEVIVEEWIKGQEITCSMIKGEIIPVLSVQPNMTFYDYTAKYSENDNIQKLAILDEEITNEIKSIASLCWFLFRLKTYARIDIIIQEGQIYVIEINTLPGMTRFSHLPKSAMAMGLSYEEVLDQIIESSLTDHPSN